MRTLAGSVLSTDFTFKTRGYPFTVPGSEMVGSVERADMEKGKDLGRRIGNGASKLFKCLWQYASSWHGIPSAESLGHLIGPSTQKMSACVM